MRGLKARDAGTAVLATSNEALSPCCWEGRESHDFLLAAFPGTKWSAEKRSAALGMIGQEGPRSPNCGKMKRFIE